MPCWLRPWDFSGLSISSNPNTSRRPSTPGNALQVWTLNPHNALRQVLLRSSLHRWGNRGTKTFKILTSW